jgi:putative membrane protein
VITLINHFIIKFKNCFGYQVKAVFLFLKNNSTKPYPMKTLLQIILTGIIVLVLSNILGGVYVTDFFTAVVVAALLALLNIFVKPILLILTLPVTVLTFGLFLLVINALIILMADGLVSGFRVEGFWWAVLFSILLSFLQSLIFSLAERRNLPRGRR